MTNHYKLFTTQFKIITLTLLIFCSSLLLISCAQMGTGLNSQQIQKVKNINTISDNELMNLYFDVERKIRINKAQMQDASAMNNPMAQGFEQGQHSNLLKIKEKIVVEMNERNLDVPEY